MYWESPTYRVPDIPFRRRQHEWAPGVVREISLWGARGTAADTYFGHVCGVLKERELMQNVHVIFPHGSLESRREQWRWAHLNENIFLYTVPVYKKWSEANFSNSAFTIENIRKTK